MPGNYLRRHQIALCVVCKAIGMFNTTVRQLFSSIFPDNTAIRIFNSVIRPDDTPVRILYTAVLILNDAVGTFDGCVIDIHHATIR
ncbi:hypothetical protein DCO47_11155 [Pseudomonas sp. NDM]|uniref:Uncharacterized protein n=1 Tax=Pseudomonas fluorescens TaxID=294 RepID=A0AAE2ATZ5_PSEFL|nr:hypothetical protein RU10_16650 [Pseudomonas fluorescens]PWB35784.1 hypothetical protein DCO47_11155 [Pseudomonas sp. NDM]